MRRERKYVLSIAGFDPSAGAGILADIKTFEMNKVYGLGVISANTYQDDKQFVKVEWIEVDKMLEQIRMLAERFPIEYIKIGLIESLDVLQCVIEHCRKMIPDVKIIWDPIIRASVGFEFHADDSFQKLNDILPGLFLVTPNVTEARVMAKTQDSVAAGEELSRRCCVLLKGGHREDKKGYDTLFLKEGKQFSFRPRGESVYAKHGSGCVLSAAIAANLANGESLQRACLMGKEYAERILASNMTLLGYHR